MVQANNLVGQKFGRLVVLRKSGVDKKRNFIWECKCECGNLTSAPAFTLRSGGKKSCGCLWLEQHLEKHKTHGESGSRLYRIYRGMRQRCENKNSNIFKHYGGRGIKVCPEWKKYTDFKKWVQVSNYANGLSIERINVNGDYEPKNCTWIHRSHQQRNRRNTLRFKFNGTEKTLTEWSSFLGIKYSTLYCRIFIHNYDIDTAFNEEISKLQERNCLQCKKVFNALRSRPNKYCCHRCYTNSNIKK